MKKGTVRHCIIAVTLGAVSGFVISLAVFLLAVSLVRASGSDSLLSFVTALKGDLDANVRYALLWGVLFIPASLLSLRELASGRERWMGRTIYLWLFLITVLACILAGIGNGLYLRVVSGIIYSAAAAAVCAAAVIVVRRSFFWLYSTLLSIFMVENKNAYLLDTEFAARERVPDYELFLRELEDLLAVSRRIKRPLGIMGVRIANQLALIERYSSDGYDALEKQLIDLIRRHARTGENQCLVQKGSIISVVFADSDSAYKALARFEKLVAAHRFVYRNAETDVRVVFGAAGFDFARTPHSESASELRDVLLLRTIDALTDAEHNNAIVVNYQ
ncbi:MAG: hypothetical protein AABZ39_06720 [Spirochaetota bacterium]